MSAALSTPAALALLLATGATLPAAAASPEAFERAFPARGEPAALHYEVEYQDAQGPHRLAVWREGSTRLRRQTDGRLDLLAERTGDDELRLQIVDHRRRIVTAVSRTELYRIGHGLDWFSLAHGLTRPASAYTVARLRGATTLTEAAAPIAACRWFELAEGARRSTVCWSPALHLPLLIARADGHVVWRVTAAQAGRFDAANLAVPAAGYVRVDADEDIRAD